MTASQSHIHSSWTDQRSYLSRMKWHCWSDFFKRDDICKMRWYIDSEMNMKLWFINQLSHNMLYIADSQLTAEQYKSADIKTQCQKCQKFKHATRHCVNQNWCQICAKSHDIKLHRCYICNTTDVKCFHAKLKCIFYFICSIKMYLTLDQTLI